MAMKRFLFLVLSSLFLCSSFTLYAQSEGSTKEEGIYENLQNRIKNHWNENMDSFEGEPEPLVAVEGNFAKRLLRSILNAVYRNMESIKVGSAIIGLFSFVLGVVIAAASKINKKMRKFAVSFFVIAIPVLLFVFVYGMALIISYYQ